MSADLWVALAYVVPYVLIFGMYAKSGARVGIQLVPFLACAAAFGTARVGRIVAVTALGIRRDPIGRTVKEILIGACT